ncbi:MAG: SAM-dependent DNA methyltransferase, partial [Bacteroidetes bacterium]|nr:SAM-dependent DNA methyltransferase [Bacteroidota bacterium]
MTPLHKTLRSTLEKTVKKARDVAEEGALAALQQLGVGDKQKPGFLTDEQAELRRRLRARGRQLGDTLHADGAQDLTRLTREVAYEHWHRMLFARYLAANRLLMHPDLNMPVTLSDCNELAEEENVRDGFVLAARYATQMLPQIFRTNDPVLDV